MAELVIECPAPDGHMDLVNTHAEPQTNSRIREFLKKHHGSPSGSAVDSGNSSDDQQRQLANQSPPPNCSICLGRVKSKCFTDSCMHQFCFSCLLEWSKVKPECPLCKQAFKSIIHNVTSMDSYEEYKVEVQQRQVNWINLPFQPNVDMNLLFSASIPTYQMQRPADHASRSTDSSRRRLFQLLRHETPESPLVQRFAQTYPDEIYPTRISGTQWRSYIYNRRLYAEPLNDLSGHSRDISATFYRSNPAQMHRLLSWLHRELVCLTTGQSYQISHIVQRIDELIQTYDMTSFDFQSRIRTLVPTHTDHFIHELINFARSPYDSIGYDRHVRYLPRFESEPIEVVTVSSSEEGSDIEFVGAIESTNDNTSNIASNQNTSSNDNENRINIIIGSSSSSISNRNDSIDQTGASTSGTTTTTTAGLANVRNISADDSDEEEIRTYLRHKPIVSAEELIRGRTGPTPPAESSTPAAAGDTDRSDFDSERTIIIAPTNVQSIVTASTSQATNTLVITPKVEPNTQTKQTQDVINADGNDSDSDECLFVCAKKPPHLRTPEYVELNSDSDSDVVFVSSETCQTPMVNITTSHLDVAHDVRKSILSEFHAQRNETSTNLRRKRGRTTVDTSSTTYTNQTASTNTYEAKPSTSEAMLQWLIQPSEEEPHSRRISPKASSRQHSSPSRPRITTTIKISRGKRIYESPSSEEETDRDESTDPESSSSSSSKTMDSSDVESSSQEEYVCPGSRVRSSKRSTKTDDSCLPPRKRFRKRRGKRIYESSSSDGSDEED